MFLVAKLATSNRSSNWPGIIKSVEQTWDHCITPGDARGF